VIPPSSRTLIGTFAIIGLIILWAALVIMGVEQVSGWPVLAKMAIYLVAGIAWVIPLGPLLRWMQTGHFRR
jgi:hypothetical protein